MTKRVCALRAAHAWTQQEGTAHLESAGAILFVNQRDPRLLVLGQELVRMNRTQYFRTFGERKFLQ